MKRVGLAIVGAGHWGPNLIRILNSLPTCDLRWVVDRDPVQLHLVKTRYPTAVVAPDVTKALEDPQVDAVVIATPTSTHYDLARSTLKAGKHVFIEKPIATNVRSATELVELAQSKQLVLLVGHVFLYNSAVEWIRNYLRSGHLGDVRYLTMTRTNLGPIRTDINVAWDLAAHDISMANYWLGSEPISVSATGEAWLKHHLPDVVFATFRYPGDVLLHVHVSWVNPKKSRDVSLVGEKRTLTFDDMSLDEPIRVYDRGVEEPPSEVAGDFATFQSGVRFGDVHLPTIRMDEPLRVEMEDFLAAILDERAPRVTGKDAIAVVGALEALDESLANNGAERAIS